MRAKGGQHSRGLRGVRRRAQMSSPEPEWAAGEPLALKRVGRNEGTPFRLQCSCTNAHDGRTHVIE
eukprot:6214373-Pleurochrysis_carterae.AAC.6